MHKFVRVSAVAAAGPNFNLGSAPSSYQNRSSGGYNSSGHYNLVAAGAGTTLQPETAAAGVSHTNFNVQPENYLHESLSADSLSHLFVGGAPAQVEEVAAYSPTAHSEVSAAIAASAAAARAGDNGADGFGYDIGGDAVAGATALNTASVNHQSGRHAHATELQPGHHARAAAASSKQVQRGPANASSFNNQRQRQQRHSDQGEQHQQQHHYTPQVTTMTQQTLPESGSTPTQRQVQHDSAPPPQLQLQLENKRGHPLHPPDQLQLRPEEYAPTTHFVLTALPPDGIRSIAAAMGSVGASTSTSIR